MINRDLLKRTLFAVKTSESLKLSALDEGLNPTEFHGQLWNQSQWRCETGMCFAGFAAQLNGRVWATDNPAAFPALAAYVLATPEEVAAEQTISAGSWHSSELPEGFTGDLIHVSDAARHDLGTSADYDDPNYDEGLFDGSNSLPRIERLVASLLADD